MSSIAQNRIPENSRSPFRLAFRLAVFLGLLILGLAAQASRWADVFLGEHVFFLDPDCYSRMTRVMLVLAGEGPSIRFHDFENAPFGVAPHTTGLLDWLIAGSSLLLRPIELDLVAAWVPLALGVLFLCAVAVWSWSKPYGPAALALAATSPILAHGFSIGRPDHQCLLILLLTGALMSELALWNKSPHANSWALVSAILWALSLWVSLFEPLILLIVCLGLRAFVLGRALMPTDWKAPTTFVGILVFSILVDGLRISLPDPTVMQFFPAWSASIGELKPASWATLAGWLGWLGLGAPVLLLYQSLKTRTRPPAAAGILLLLLLVLTSSTARWGYFAAVFCALTLPGVMTLLHWRWMAWTVFLISLWPLARTWETQLFPEGEAARQVLESRQENLLLRETATHLRTIEPGVVLAPWWSSPALAYWSGHPTIAGSSHQSLPGIADTARFYTSTSPQEAWKILQHRKVLAVIADDPKRILQNSSQLLGIPIPENPIAQALVSKTPPPFLKPEFQNRFFRILIVRNDF